MPQAIGFLDFQKRWDGPVILEFTFVEKHTKTIRYESRLKRQKFRLYAPFFLVPGSEAGIPPDRILVALGKTEAPLRTIGFREEATPLSKTSDICEFEFFQMKENSVRYLVQQERDYSLYIPKEVFGGEKHPPRVYLQVAVPAGESRRDDGGAEGKISSVDYSKIITIESGKRSGKPCIRGLRITVYDVLSYLAAGMRHQEILEDFPDLTEEDIRACLAYAADAERRFEFLSV